MKNILHIFLLCLCSFGAACAEDPELEPGRSGEGDAWVTLDFGHTPFDQVRITTRSSLGVIAESRVSNLYIYVFDHAGNRVYGYYFDEANKCATRSEVQNADHNCWMVDNMLDAVQGEPTRGTVRMKVPQLTGGTICLIANVDPDMADLSPEKLNLIHTQDELNALTAKLNQEITSRNGMFPMTGSQSGVSISKSGIASDTGQRVEVKLTRLDAKVEVRFRVAVGNETISENGGTTTRQRLKDFIPESWQVVNLPKGSYICERNVTEKPHDAAASTGYFNSGAVNFETESKETFTYTNNSGKEVMVSSPVYGFSFYMLENRPEAKKTIKTFHERDKRLKHDDGTYDTAAGMWENAPETATYLVVKGEVAMDVDVSSGAKDQMLNALVTYYIHLGDFKTDVNDYSIERNTHYTYTVTIKGVESIQVEVATKTEERESGATGQVYIARESVYTFDSHYGQRVFAFDQESITPETVTWYVSTPFGREGMPENVGGVEVPNGLDYKWVKFRINQTDPISGGYSHRNRTYDPDDVMDILEFCAYIKEQKMRFDANRPNDFKTEEDAELKRLYPSNPEIYTRHRIYVTIFVDEFYYDRDPISGETRPSLWKEFVNQPNRMMHILCETDFSADKESSATGSVVTIRQRSIQSTYDITNPSLKTAWGCETTDETNGALWFYNRKETKGDTTPRPDWGNDSYANGLYNTARIWNLTNRANGFTSHRWDEYLDYDRENDYQDADDNTVLFLRDRDDLATARYTCLMRNRDNNGNGLIEAEEIRWYIASIQQLSALYTGDQGILYDAQLYDQNHSYGKDQVNKYGLSMWRSHIISSTQFTGDATRPYYPTILWAEEGVSTSAYQQWPGKSGRYSVRCVRNLGMDPTDEQDAIRKINDPENLPERSVIFSEITPNDKTENAVYRFEMEKINKKSLRYYTSRELEPGDEFSESARVYSAFETGPTVEAPESYLTLKAQLERGESPCPDGYRVPNIREASLMSNYITEEVNPNWWQGYHSLVNTYYSFGTLGKNYDSESQSWYFSMDHIAAVPQRPMNIRCVKDVR